MGTVNKMRENMLPVIYKESEMTMNHRAAFKKRSSIQVLLSLVALVAGMGVADAAIQCYECHGTKSPVDQRPLDTASRDVATGAFQGNHRTHMNSSATATSCVSCHNNSGYTSNHRDGLVQISANINSSPATGQYMKSGSPVTSFAQTATPTLGTCSNTNCHFETATPTWGGAVYTYTNGTTNDCNKCHGNGTSAAPGDATHTKHITAYGTDVATCGKCHPGYTTFTHATSAGKRNLSVVMSPGTYSGTTLNKYLPSQSAQRTYGSCSTTYCHGGGTAVWRGAAMTCGSCHGADNTGLLSGATGASPSGHTIHYNSASVPAALNAADAHSASGYVYGCQNCHPNGGSHVLVPADGTGPVYQDAEIGGTKLITANYAQAGSSTTDSRSFKYTNGTCTTVCHSKDGTIGTAVSVAWSTTKTGNCNVCHSAPGDASRTWSTLHDKHTRGSANTAYSFTCDYCHSGTATNNTTINGSSGRGLHPNAAKDVALNGTAGGTWSGTQCSNTYCHSNGTSTTGSHAALSWTGNTTCGVSCHNGVTTLVTNAHAAHLNNSTKVGKTVGCADCHAATASGDTTISAATGYTEHVNKLTNVKFDNSINKNTDSPTWATVATTGASGSTRAPGGAATAVCSNVYCHSIGNVDGTGTVVAGGGASFRSVAWNATIGCDGCHGDQAGKAHPVYTSGAAGSTTANTHVKHVEGSGLSCDYCHLNTTTDTTIPPTTVIAGQHLNRIESWQFKTIATKSGSYDASKNCSNTYCHGSGTAQWGGAALNCGSCHGADNTGLLSGATGASPSGHTIHYNSSTLPTSLTGGDAHSATGYVYGCQNCHPNGGSHSTGPANGSAPLQDAAINGTKLLTGNYTPGGTSTTDSRTFNYTNGTCTTVCHSRDGLIGTAVSVAWSTTKTGNCNVCHSAPGDATRTWSVKHDKHTRGSANSSYSYTCDYCHSGTATNNTTINGATGRGLHPNAVKNVGFNAFAEAAATYPDTATGCSNTYCHSNGTANTSPTHTAITWASSVTCGVSCHNGVTTLTTNKHAAHLNSVTTAGRVINCAECHAATASGNTTIDATNGYAAHVNKLTNIKFDNSINLDSASPTWNGTSTTTAGTGATRLPGGAATATCANIYCHSNGNTRGGATPSYVSVAWNATLGCDGCHGTTGKSHPSYTTGGAATTTANTHVVHVETQGYGCDYCHVSTTTDAAIPPTTVVSGSLHFNRAEDVTLNTTAAKAGTTAAYNSGSLTCATTRCHGSSSPVWGTNNVGNTCTKCHGQTATAYANVSSAVIAPGGAGRDTNGNTATSDAQVGFHQAHLTAASSYSRTIRCGECHTTVTSVGLAGHIDSNLPAEVPLNGAIARTNPRSVAGTPTYSSGSCSNVYCHDYRRFKNGWAADATTVTAPTWNVAMITGQTGSARCKKCHGYAPGGAHSANTDCSSCHTHVAADDISFSNPALHMNGTVEAQAGESSGGASCGGCHSDLYNSTTTVYSMHSNTAGISYKHYMDNDTATYSNLIPDGASTNLTSRRCTMCHVDHNIFKVPATATAGRAFNMRDRADGSTSPTAGYNSDYKLCLSCHYTEKTKAVTTANGNTKVMPVPFPGLTFANATSVLTFSTHGYAVTSQFNDGTLGNTQFNAICTKCHNDSIGRNGDLGGKSSVTGQDSTYKFGSHNSTIPSRFSVFGNHFYQGAVAAYNSSAKTVQVTPNPGWQTDEHKGHYIVVTSGTGNNQRALVTANTADTVTVFAAFATAIDNTSRVDIVNDNLSVDNICFSCHSKNGQGKSNGANLDWYGQESMSTLLEGMYDLFTGDSGTVAALNRATSVTVTTKNSWAAGALVGYQFKTPGGTRTILTQTAASTGSGPYSTTFTIATLSTAAGPYQILKPASHPLDSYGRHDSYERVTATSGWNKGDSGTATAATATSVTDSSKLWTGSEFNGLKIFFPGNFDSSGNPAQSTVTGGASAGVVTFGAIAGYTPQAGDNFYIGTRHVSCADCHNTHAAFKNPEGTVTSGTSTTLVANDSKNISGWSDGKWVGYLLKLRKSTGSEQIRYITGFTLSTGSYTVSLPWSTNPAANDSYEVLMGDKWTSTGQSGGRAGSGSSGVWGTVITSFPAITRGNGTLTAVPVGNFSKIENVFDNTGSLGGNANAGQRDLCIRCHSSYSYGTATPMTPSGNADGTSSRSTDVAAEFNPQNVAHHAVYARGNNQPITATGQTAGATSYYNTSWPKYSTGTIGITTAGVATLSGGTLPSTVIPGWYVYIGNAMPPATATTNWYQITSITSGTSFTVKPNPGTAVAAGTAYAVTAGLGNSFVPPYGPWSILRCTDCHGSTKTDPVGPHASINKWLIKDADTSLQFEWFNGTSVQTINYQNTTDLGGTGYALTNSYDKGYLCFNCHRADVYGSEALALGKGTPPKEALSRLKHGTVMWAKDGSNIGKARDTGAGKATYFAQYCRHCHGGDKIGGIHGSNMARVAGDTRPQSVRFLNGATWNNGLAVPTAAGTSITCYTQGSVTAVSRCTQHSGGTSYTHGAGGVTYDYTGY